MWLFGYHWGLKLEAYPFTTHKISLYGSKANGNKMIAKNMQNLNYLEKYLRDLVEIFRESSTLVDMHWY